MFGCFFLIDYHTTYITGKNWLTCNEKEKEKKRTYKIVNSTDIKIGVEIDDAKNTFILFEKSCPKLPPLQLSSAHLHSLTCVHLHVLAQTYKQLQTARLHIPLRSATDQKVRWETKTGFTRGTLARPSMTWYPIQTGPSRAPEPSRKSMNLEKAGVDSIGCNRFLSAHPRNFVEAGLNCWMRRNFGTNLSPWNVERDFNTWASLVLTRWLNKVRARTPPSFTDWTTIASVANIVGNRGWDSAPSSVRANQAEKDSSFQIRASAQILRDRSWLWLVAALKTSAAAAVSCYFIAGWQFSVSSKRRG